MKYTCGLVGIHSTKNPPVMLVSGLDANACVICDVTNHCSVVIMGKHIVIVLSGVK